MRHTSHHIVRPKWLAIRSGKDRDRADAETTERTTGAVTGHRVFAVTNLAHLSERGLFIVEQCRCRLVANHPHGHNIVRNDSR
jgi:hypothetical protein